MKKLRNAMLIVMSSYLLSSCGEMKKIYTGNVVYRYVDNQELRNDDDTKYDRLEIYVVDTAFKSRLDDKTDFVVIKDDTYLKTLKPDTTIDVKPPVQSKVDLKGVYYTTESNVAAAKDYRQSFIYGDIKFGMQALTIPLKFRKAIGDGVLNPSTVETGFNVGFAPSVKFTRNVFNPLSKTMGKSLNQYSLTTGLLLNLGTTDLKKASNAPGILSDRKSATFTYGTFVMFGINNINFGYAFGIDNLLGNKGANWVYNKKGWHGIIVSLDVLKF